MDFFGANGSSRDDKEIMLFASEVQMKDSQQTMTRTSAYCFDSCVNTFTSSKISPTERTCIQNCTNRYFAFYQRIGLRFAEENAKKQEEQQ